MERAQQAAGPVTADNPDMEKYRWGVKKKRIFFCLLAVTLALFYFVYMSYGSSSLAMFPDPRILQQAATDFGLQPSPVSAETRDSFSMNQSIAGGRNLQVSGKAIVYACVTMGECGGWADRQKGIVGSYVLSQLLRRRFKIEMRVPCDLSAVVLPGEVNWTLARGELDAETDKVTVRAIDVHQLPTITNILKNEDLEAALPHQVTILQTNMEIVQFLVQHKLAASVAWLQGQSVPEIYRLALARLFQPGPKVSALLEQFRKALPAGKRLVCAQIRIGDVGGMQFHTLQQVAVVEAFLKQHVDARTSRLLLTTDTSEVVELGRRQFPEALLTFAGPITHVDKTRGDAACDGFVKAISEQLTLATCDVLVMSESGFGKIASFMRGRDSDLYLFYNDKLVTFTRNATFPTKIAW